MRIESTISAHTGRGNETAAGRQRAGSSSHQGAAPAAVSGGVVVEQLLLEDAARELAAQLASIESPEGWASWRTSHRAILAAVYRLLPECPAKRRLTAASGAAKAAFGSGPKPKKAQSRGESRRST